MALISAAGSQPTVLKSPQLSKIAWLAHGFSTRNGGASRVYGGRALNLGFTKQDSRSAVERNRRKFLRQLQVSDSWPVVTLRQVHSDLIHHTNAAPKHPLTCDGLITAKPGILLAIQT
ncbi:MAG TPA: laccase domain-containing protein, partial [Terriglobales bacterium]|nr:laccase domain-containing protein [Terriglobales bacterium]